MKLNIHSHVWRLYTRIERHYLLRHFYYALEFLFVSLALEICEPLVDGVDDDKIHNIAGICIGCGVYTYVLVAEAMNCIAYHLWSFHFVRCMNMRLVTISWNMKSRKQNSIQFWTKWCLLCTQNRWSTMKIENSRIDAEYPRSEFIKTFLVNAFNLCYITFTWM